MSKLYYLYCDEYYPYYGIAQTDTEGCSITLTDVEKDDFDRVMEEFKAWQRKFKEAYKCSSMSSSGG